MKVTREEFRRKLRDLTGMSLRRFAGYVGLNEDTVYHWADVPQWAVRMIELWEGAK